MLSQIVPIIVIFIIVLQVFFFIKNLLRMIEYKKIFSNEQSWRIAHDNESGFVWGIAGKGNKVFESIKDSINKYLSNNSGSVIDFQLLKDAVDRHCDAVEDDINTLTPVPLYCGLAGTMAGVIIGLYSLLDTGSITALLSSGEGDFGTAANGVNDLLSGVAWAMLASICGIFLTTLSSILFKRYKLKGESGKNSFLAWLQSKLLPELPSDTSDALNRLVKNLNNFNNTFASNTTELRGALSKVNESYRIQADIIKAVQAMDVMKMANANVKVLKELQECTDKLEEFHLYLDDVHGYTDAIHKFTTQFEQEANRLHVLEEIKNYFSRHKAEIAKETAEADVVLRTALRTMKESAGENVKELNTTLVQQAEEFKMILKDEKESFEAINNEMRSQFAAQLSQMPMLERKLAEISAIPSKLDVLIEKMERSNANLAQRITSTMHQTTQQLSTMSARPINSLAQQRPVKKAPAWMRWIIVISLILITLACITNTIFNMFVYSNSSSEMILPSPIERIEENAPEEQQEDLVEKQDEDIPDMLDENPIQNPLIEEHAEDIPDMSDEKSL